MKIELGDRPITLEMDADHDIGHLVIDLSIDLECPSELHIGDEEVERFIGKRLSLLLSLETEDLYRLARWALQAAETKNQRDSQLAEVAS